MFIFFFLMIRRPPRSTLFPYRRSSDLNSQKTGMAGADQRYGRLDFDRGVRTTPPGGLATAPGPRFVVPGDRKSTRLNSSHANISYAVFCLKKKKRNLYNQVFYTDTQ